VLGGLYYGTTYYWPDAYVAIGRPYCRGVTPDGCVLRWREVELDDGSTEWQCVRLCPRANVAPPVPPPAVPEPLPEPAPAQTAVPAGSCSLSIFSEANFAGDTDEATEDQPELDVWHNEIASLQVKTGTWDFYSEPDYQGDVMRLGPGQYPTLDAAWTKRIGSFMCASP
jgi:hypothetical protein